MFGKMTIGTIVTAACNEKLSQYYPIHKTTRNTQSN